MAVISLVSPELGVPGIAAGIAAMIEAGSLIYRRSLLGCDHCDGGEELVVDVFSAMLEALGQSR